MLLTRYGIREWMIITLAAAIPAAAGVFFGWWWLVGVAVVVWMALASFFRDPLGRRPASSDPRDLVSPADGLVKSAILGGNSARLYGVQVRAAQGTITTDKIAAIKREYIAAGGLRSNARYGYVAPAPA